MRKRTVRKNGTKKGQVRKTARKAYKRNGTKKGQVRKTARRAYKRKPLSAAKKKAAAKKRAATIAAKKRKLAAAARKRKATIAAKKRKAAAAKRKRTMSRKVRRNGTKKGMVRKTARKAYKRKNPSRCKNGKVSKSSGRGTCSSNRGVKSKITRRQYTKTRKSLRLNPKHKAKKRVVKRRNTAHKKNPAHKRKTRIIRKNPLALPILAPLQNLVSKVPVLGKKVAPYTQPAVVAMLGGAGNALFFNMLASKIPYADKIFGNAFGYTISGLSLAVVSAFLPLKPQTKQALAISLAAAGGALNAAQIVSEGFSLKAVSESNKLKMLGSAEDLVVEEMSDMGGAHMSGAHMSGAHLGDGMYYDVQSLGGVAHLNEQMYNGAHLGDALAAPADLSASEGKAALLGMHHFAGVFGSPPHRAAGAKSWYSSCAGKMGHRWGWLIQSIGFENFKKLVEMPKRQRMLAIGRMKAAAIRAAKKSFEPSFDDRVAASFQASQLGGLAMDMSGLAVDMGGHGDMHGLAMDMSGVAYDEMDMSGLAIDTLNGLAVVGAGI